MTCPKCGLQQPDGNNECARCGVIFARIHADPQLPECVSSPGENSSEKPGGMMNVLFTRAGEIILNVPPEMNRLIVAGRAVVYLVLVIWGLRLMTSTIESCYVGESFMHMVNIPFHEAGHVFLAPFGHFMHVLGGTLGQLLIPFIVLCSFLLKRDHFGATVGLWWFGENFLDIAPYVDDARAGQLILLRGFRHRAVRGGAEVWAAVTAWWRRFVWLPFWNVLQQ